MFRTRTRRLVSIASLLSLAAQLLLVAVTAAASGGADFPLR